MVKQRDITEILYWKVIYIRKCIVKKKNVETIFFGTFAFIFIDIKFILLL
jgi:hypothetical protein